MKDTEKELPELCYWRRWEKRFHEPTTMELKYALSKRKKNGLDRCVIIINNKMYLNVKETFKYFNEDCREVPTKILT